ncbi:hypothetical protein JX265_010846 [Neoarthrinium moseri]|uniref:Uncharacterized protein n=1 Tax=Neoarthrinium moseri TaxID=1658444 RepID=A0A9Q0AI21_9PEZI|nr:hypothetical protein JX265_010846 [Neoarthrinium moseri]
MAATTAPLFFNLAGETASKANETSFFGAPKKHSLETNWATMADQPMTSQSVLSLFANQIPLVREKKFLSTEECQMMYDIIKTHELGSYDTENTWPRVGIAGITQYDHMQGRFSHVNAYFDAIEAAQSLQNRWKKEAGVDVLQRVMDKLQNATGMPVRRAREGDREYFAGILRAVDAGMHVHADYAPYEAAGWSIDGIVSQLTWNILLNEIPGGDTLVYDRQWRAPDDDLAWRKTFPRDSYHPQMLEGHTFKAVKATPGDLTFFNPRNFHEVKGCDTSRDKPKQAIRFTISSFVGYLPAQGSEPDTLVLWS